MSQMSSLVLGRPSRAGGDGRECRGRDGRSVLLRGWYEAGGRGNRTAINAELRTHSQTPSATSKSHLAWGESEPICVVVGSGKWVEYQSVDSIWHVICEDCAGISWGKHSPMLGSHSARKSVPESGSEIKGRERVLQVLQEWPATKRKDAESNFFPVIT